MNTIADCATYLYSAVATFFSELNETSLRLLGAYNGCEEEEHYNSF